MDQDDIFKLLLIILLVSNEQEHHYYPESREEFYEDRHFHALNEIILVALLFNTFFDSDRDERRRERLESRERLLRARETTF